MSPTCRHLDKLSAAGLWDDVFACLHIDPDSKFELANVEKSKVPPDDSWLDENRAINNSLTIILALILLVDNILYILFLIYLLLFICQYVRYRGFALLKNFITISRWRQLAWAKLFNTRAFQRAVETGAGGDFIIRR